MVNYPEWFTQKEGKVQLNSIAIYKTLSSEILSKLDNNLSVTEILNWIKNKTVEAFQENYGKSPQVGALNNAVGRWNEFIATSLFSEIVTKINQNQNACVAIFSLPPSQVQPENSGKPSSKFISLFSQEEFENGKSLDKITKENIFIASPDYIIAVLQNKSGSNDLNILLKQQAKEPNSLALFNLLKGQLKIEEVKAAVSLKTSNRPDRRYQPLFEAAMIKAMGYVLQQQWRYYMVVSELSNADKIVFDSAVAPHGVALQQDLKLVDGTYLYSRKEDLVALIEAAVK